ncbi:MAG: LysR family transcriptional regulator [Burkholderiaceae bacterium]
MGSLQDLALFVEVVRAGSFRHASVRLSMPLSTLSRRIAALEQRLGMRLLVRTTRSVALASAAKPFFERCLEVMDAATRAEEALVGGSGRQAVLRVSMPVDLGVELLGPAIAQFADTQPGLRVELDLSSQAVDLMREPVDLALRIGKPMDDRVVARKIADVTSGVYAAPALLRRLPTITAVEQLQALPCLDLRTAQGSMAWKVGTLRWDAAPGPCVLGANSVALVRTWAEEGRGLALLPAHVVAQSVQARRLVRVLTVHQTTSWPVYAVTATRSVPRQVGLLIARVKATLARTPLVPTDWGGLN